MCRHLARPRIQTRTGGERGKRKAQERSARQDRLYVIAKLCGILRVAAAIQRRTSVKPSRYPFGAISQSSETTTENPYTDTRPTPGCHRPSPRAKSAPGKYPPIASQAV
jgi:hypothetical protein